MSVSVVKRTDAKDLGEGPHWDPLTNQILYIEIFEGSLHRLDVTTDKHESYHVEGDVGFIIPSEGGGYVVGNGLKLIQVDWEKKTQSTLAELHDPAIKFNDAKCDALGRLWVGTMGRPVDGKFPEKMGGLYSYDETRGLRKHVDGLSLTNGMVFSKDNSILYLVDSTMQTVFAFDFDLKKGEVSNQRAIKSFKGFSPGFSMPDGLTIDVEEKLWVAMIPKGSVVRFDPINGEVLQQIEFPVTQTTSCCFGGQDLSELYVTTGRYKLKEEEEKAQPEAASLFKVTGLGVKGQLAHIYKGKVQ